MRAAPLAGFFLVMLPGLALAADPAAAPVQQQHRLVTLELDGPALRVLASQVVPLPLPKRRGGEAVGSGHPWRARLLGPGGAVLHTLGLGDPTELRVEHADDAGRIRAQRVRREGPVVFCLRLPLTAGRLELQRLDPARPRERRAPEDAWQGVGAVELPGVAP
ncbi:MAG TPA: hypothetical protein PK668_18185 [Myxococcota bacterium]|nr:hypothetical protein [Myxococcota bacterium]HRY95893.1 hypothetical protein [Myxococcota bacterium]HSA22412.1 hypothetical protein [Myxococcota bacterium]